MQDVRLLKMVGQETKRIAYLDILRVLATLGVIFIHITADGLSCLTMSYNWYVAMVGDGLVRWAVPVFVMISGALFLNPEKTVLYKNVLTKKVPRLLTAYIAWWFIYAAAIVVVWHFLKNEPVQTDWVMPHYHLWFLPMLIGVYLLIPVLRKIASDRKLLVSVLLIWAVYLLVIFVFTNEIKRITPLYVVHILIGYSGYFLLGYYLSDTIFSRMQRVSVYILGIIGIMITIGGLDELYLSYLSLHVAMMSAALFVFVKENSTNIGVRVRRFVDYVKNDLFGIYLVHPMWLMLVNKDIIRDLCNHAVSLPLICIITFVMSLYMVKIIRKIPGVRRIVE